MGASTPPPSRIVWPETPSETKDRVDRAVNTLGRLYWRPREEPGETQQAYELKMLELAKERGCVIIGEDGTGFCYATPDGSYTWMRADG